MNHTLLLQDPQNNQQRIDTPVRALLKNVFKTSVLDIF